MLEELAYIIQNVIRFSFPTNLHFIRLWVNCLQLEV